MQGKVVDYTIVMALGDVDLVARVQGAIKAGWEPQGGVVFAPGTTKDPETNEMKPTGFLVQAIVRREGSAISLVGALAGPRQAHG